MGRNTHFSTPPFSHFSGGMGGNRGKWRKMWGNGGDWGIAGIAHGVWVVEGCGGMWLRKMGQQQERNGTKYPFLNPPPFSHFSGGRIHSPQFPLENSARHTHRRKNGNFCHSRTLTGEAGFSFPGGGGVDRALRPDPPPPTKRAQLTGPPKPTETDPWASEVTQTQKSEKKKKTGFLELAC